MLLNLEWDTDRREVHAIVESRHQYTTYLKEALPLVSIISHTDFHAILYLPLKTNAIVRDICEARTIVQRTASSYSSMYFSHRLVLHKRHLKVCATQVEERRWRRIMFHTQQFGVSASQVTRQKQQSAPCATLESQQNIQTA